MSISANLARAAALFAALGACSPAANDAPPPEAPVEAPAAVEQPIRVAHARVTPTPGGADMSAGYLDIANAGAADDRLIAAESPRAARVELHATEMDGAVMRMRAQEAVPIPAGQTVQFAPHGLHLMLMGLSAPFAEGETVPITLTFEHAGAVTVEAPVQRETAAH